MDKNSGDLADMGKTNKDVLEGVEKLTAHVEGLSAKVNELERAAKRKAAEERLVGATNVGKRLNLRIDDDTGNVYADDEHMFMARRYSRWMYFTHHIGRSLPC